MNVMRYTRTACQADRPQAEALRLILDCAFHAEGQRVYVRGGMSRGLMKPYELLRIHTNTPGIGLRVGNDREEPQGFSLRHAPPNTLFGVTS